MQQMLELMGKWSYIMKAGRIVCLIAFATVLLGETATTTAPSWTVGRRSHNPVYLCFELDLLPSNHPHRQLTRR
jgi:hypothetical protein